MAENMVVSGDKRIRIIQTVLPTCMLFLIQALRFLRFYEVKGITIRNGWAAPIHSKRIFLFAFFLFLIGVWVIKNKYAGFVCEAAALIVMMYCEKIFVEFSDYRLAWTSYGLWIDIVFTLGLLVYCFWMNIKKESS